MKFVRVILAVDDDQLEAFDDYMTCVIEADEIPDAFVVDATSNPIVGAYTSGVYDDRDAAINGDWIPPDGNVVENAPPETPDTTPLAKHIVEEEIDGQALVGFLVPFMTRTAIAALCLRLDICPIHHVDAEICADDGVTECEDFR